MSFRLGVLCLLVDIFVLLVCYDLEVLRLIVALVITVCCLLAA